MKIRISDIRRFPQLANKHLKPVLADKSQTVVFSSTENSVALEMVRDELIFTYLCNRVDSETCEQVFGVPIGLLHDCSKGIDSVELYEVFEIGVSHVAAKWYDGRALLANQYRAHDMPEYHLLSDLAWHTIDERMVEFQVSPNRASCKRR